MRKILFVVMLTNFALALNAQDTVQVKNLDEVVVTATKFAKKQSETGKVLTVIDESQIRRSAGKDLSQLLNEQAGLVVNGANSNPAKDKSVYLQGAGNGYTLILVDGVPLNDPSGISGGAYDLRLLSLDQVSRIEILKGSQSTLYGTNAIAGVINIITKQGGEKPFGGFASVNYGSYNTLKATVGVSGSGKIVNYNIGYSRLTSDGVSEAKDTTGNNHYDKDGFTQNALQANFGIRAAEHLNIKPFIRYNDFSGKYDAGAFTDDTQATYTGKLLHVGTGAQYTLDKGAFNLLYGYEQSDRKYDGAYGPSEYKGRFNQAEVFFNYDLSTHFQLLTGTSLQAYKMLDTTAVEKNPGVTITSPYLSLFAHNIAGFSMELGGRYNQHSKYGSTFTYSINPSYFVKERVKLFVNYSTGFNAPSLNQLFGQFGANPGLKPETSSHVEGGVQWASENKMANVRVSAFSRQIKDVIIYTSSGLYSNFDQQNDYGLDLEPTVRLNEKISLKGYYSFVTGSVKTKVGGKDTTYNNLFRRPKHSFGLNVTWQASPKLLVSVNLKTFGQRSDLFFDLNTFTNKGATLKAYQLLDFFAEYKMDQHVSWFINAKNVLNEDYVEINGYNALRFNAQAGVNLKF